MAFRARLILAEPFETWPLMELAAEQRYWDGLALALADSGSETGALYLLGYVAEMLLKTAYFRIAGVPSGDDIAPSLKAASNNSAWLGGNLHNLRSWVALLNAIRFAQGNPWDVLTAAAVERHVLTIDSHWRESIRYTAFAATSAELEEVLTSVDWLHNNYDTLWR